MMARLEAKDIRASAKPIVEYAPALILRKRSAKGLTETLKRIKEQIENGEDIPGEFADLAEIRPKDDREQPDGPEEANAAFDGEVFFPKPSNDEQRRIVDKIRAASGVLVQGPPGTGKSHTIANLICHLLATGQRTLITAKTPRALQVLMGKPGSAEPQESDRDRGLIDTEIRLFVSIFLAADLRNAALSNPVLAAFSARMRSGTKIAPSVSARNLKKALRKLREEKAKVNRRLRDIRESETHTQSIAEGTYRGTAARIAEAVNRDRDRLRMVHGFRSLGQDVSDFPERFAKRPCSLAPIHARETARTGPCMARSIAILRALCQSREESKQARLKKSKARHAGPMNDIADLLARNNPPAIEAIRDAFSTFRDTRRRLLAMPHSWMNDALRDIRGRQLVPVA